MQTPSSQDLCIFCATRLHYSATALARWPYPKTKSLHISTSWRGPAEAAVALKEDEEYEAGVKPSSSMLVSKSTFLSAPATSLGRPSPSKPVRLSWDQWPTIPEVNSKTRARESTTHEDKQVTGSVIKAFRGESGDAAMKPPSIIDTSGSSSLPDTVVAQPDPLTSNSGGWADMVDVKLMPEEQKINEDLATITSLTKGERRKLGMWVCECGVKNYSRLLKCHYCRAPREMSSTIARHASLNSPHNDTGTGLSSVLEEPDIDSSQHWKHLRRRITHDHAAKESEHLSSGTHGTQDVPTDHVNDRSAQEREERFTANSKGGFVGLTSLTGVQSTSDESSMVHSVSLDLQMRGTNRLRRGRVPSDWRQFKYVRFPHKAPIVRKVLAPDGFPAGADASKYTANDQDPKIREHSSLPRFSRQELHDAVVFDERAPQPVTKQAASSIAEQLPSSPHATGWKDWVVPISEEENSEAQHHPIENPAAGRVYPEIEWRDRQFFPTKPAFDERKSSADKYGNHTADVSYYTPPREAPGSGLSRRGPVIPSDRHHEGLERVKDRSRVGNREKTQRRQQRSDDTDDGDDAISARIERKRQRKQERNTQSSRGPPTPILLPEYISIGNLATVLRVRVEEFIRQMRNMGFEEMSNDHVLDAETAGLVAAEFNYEPIINTRVSEDLKALPPTEDTTYLLQRPPVITIMGHVDHGKTTLLDWLRKSSIAASEHGGITQHIGAFTVSMPSGKIITFLDTPGHAAFLSMRKRGANVTDIVILVVAADDSVKPQTIEAINHAKAAQVPIIVAINKIDKPDADIKRVQQDLARHGVEVEDFGGDTQVVCVSGKTGQGMEELEDAAVALADVLDLRAETDGQAEGWVLEATTKKAGRVATVLVRRGTIVPGSVVVAGTTWGRVRTLHNEAGVAIPSAGPGTPAEIDGWREQPEAGDEVLQAPSEQRAKEVVQLRLARKEAEKLAADVAAVNEARRLEQEKRDREEAAASEDVSNPKMEKTASPSKLIEVPFIVRGDVSGSVEAVVDSISSLGNSEVRPTILRSAVGPIAPTDVEHAAVAQGHIVSFNSPVEGNIRRMAEAAGVSILDRSIIYRLVEDVRTKLEDILPALVTTRVLGEAEVVQVFNINTKGRVTVPVAGCRVRNGLVTKGAKMRVIRAGETIYNGKFAPITLTYSP